MIRLKLLLARGFEYRLGIIFRLDLGFIYSPAARVRFLMAYCLSFVGNLLRGTNQTLATYSWQL